MSENDFLTSLNEEMPDDFGRELLAQLKAEEKTKIKPMPAAIWTVAAACFVTVLVGFVLFVSRMPNSTPLSMAQSIWQQREPITPENINLIEPLLTLGHGHADAIALSPDNNTLAVATSIGIYLHDAHDLDLPPRFLGAPEDIEIYAPYFNQFMYMEYSEDGRLFVFINRPREMILYQWDEVSQSYLKLFRLEPGSALVPQVVDISPDGTKILLGACGNNNGTVFRAYCPSPSLVRIQVTELATGENLFFRSSSKVSNAIVSVSPDWSELAYQEDNQIKLVNLESQASQMLLNVKSAEPIPWDNNGTTIPWNEMHALYFSPDGTKLGVKDSATSTMKWWEIEALEQEPLNVPAFGSDSSAFYFSRRPIAGLNPLGGQYIIGSALGILVYDYFETHPSMMLDSVAEPNSYVMSSDAHTLYALDDTGLIRVWDISSQSLSLISTRYGTGTDLDFSISADGKTFVRSSYSYYYQGLGSIFELTDTGIEQTPLSSGENGYLATPYTAVSPDSRYIAFTEKDALWLYDRQEGKATLLDNYTSTPVLVFRPDGALISITQLNNSLSTNLYTAEMLQSGEIPPRNSIEAFGSEPVSAWGFSPDGTKLMLYHCDNNSSLPQPNCNNTSLRIFDTATWEEIAELSTGLTEEGNFNNFGFSDDSNWLIIAYCGDKSDVEWTCEPDSNVVELYNLQDLSPTTEPAIRLEGMSFWDWAMFDIRPYSDGSFLMAATNYESGEASLVPYITFWHVKANGEYEELRRIQTYSITMSPDGTYFLTARNGQIELWGVPASITRGN